MCGNTGNYFIPWKILSFIMVGIFSFVSCSDEEKDGEAEVRKEYKIAVVLPRDAEMFDEWSDVIQWALDNVNASLVREKGIRLTTEWIDESAADLKEQFVALAERKDISVILGPLYSKNAYTLAEQCILKGKDKALIPATTSSEELMRAFSNDGILWCLTENDISQCEVLIYRAIQKGAKTVSLLTSNDRYGQTFEDWFGFLAQELEVNVKSIEVYEDNAMLREKMRKQLSEDTDCLICIPSDNGNTKEMNKIRMEISQAKPFVLFSDVAFILTPDSEAEGMEGVVQSHNPESGFGVAYEVRKGQIPGFGIPQYYDAVMLAGLALLTSEVTGEMDINACMRKVVDGDGMKTNWTKEGIMQAVEAIVSGEHPCVTGASGKLKFDTSIYTNVIHTVYSHWQVYQGKHLILEYNSSDDSDRTDGNIVNWNRRRILEQNFDRNVSLTYPVKQGVNALIVSSSSGWDNYRHQADAYAMYQLLLQKGFSKDNIILIAEDDIADNQRNPEPGSVRVSPFGDNVYSGVRIDYQTSKIDLSTLSDIIHGVKRDDLPRVIRSGPNHNLFVYWVGHGELDAIHWLDQRIAPKDIAALFKDTEGKNSFRQAFLAIETCYGGQVGEACKGIPGLLCMTSAHAKETSKASNHSFTYGAWLSNSFSDALMWQMSSDAGLSFNEIYRNVYNKTLGSHVSVYNYENFDNLYRLSMNDFLKP